MAFRDWTRAAGGRAWSWLRSHPRIATLVAGGVGGPVGAAAARRYLRPPIRTPGSRRLVSGTMLIILLLIVILDIVLKYFITGWVTPLSLLVSLLPFMAFLLAFAYFQGRGVRASIGMPAFIFLLDLALLLMINFLPLPKVAGYISIVRIFVWLALWVVYVIAAAHKQYDVTGNFPRWWTWGLVLLFIALVAFSVFWFWPRFSSIFTDGVKLIEAKEEAKKTAAEFAEKAAELGKEKLSYWSAFWKCFRETNPLSLQDCIREKMNPENATVKGTIDESILEFIKVELTRPAFQLTEVRKGEPLEVGAQLNVYSPKEKVNIEAYCEYKKSSGTEIYERGNIVGTDGKPGTGNESSWVLTNVQRSISDLTCRPKNALDVGYYNFKYNVIVKDVVTKSRLINLLMDKNTMRSLVENYALRNNYAVRSIQDEINVMRQLFPDLISTAYPDGKVQSKSDPGFLKPIIGTVEFPIIGYTPGEDDRLILRLAVENTEDGVPKELKDVKFTLPEQIKVITKDCDQYSSIGANGYALKPIVLQGLKGKDGFTERLKKGKTLPFPACYVNLKDLVTLNPNVPEPQTFEFEIKYDYQISKEFNMKVSASALSATTQTVDKNIDGVGASKDQLKAYLDKMKSSITGGVLEDTTKVADWFYTYGTRYGVKPEFGLAVASFEADWGKSVVAKECNNLFGITKESGADICKPGTTYERYAKFTSVERGIERFFEKIKTQYLTKGQNTPEKMLAPGITNKPTICETEPQNYYCCTANSGRPWCYCCDSMQGYTNWLNTVSTRMAEVRSS